jgi:hydrogenase maturation protease
VSDPVRAIADAVLYEGYLLWPYRRSAMKNQQRWTFGGVYPPVWNAEHPDDRSEVSAECAWRGDVEIQVRFLQVVQRQVELRGEPVDSARVGGERVLSWEEAREREVRVGSGQWTVPISVAAGSEREDLGENVSVVRSWHALQGVVDVGAGSVSVRNETPFDGGTRQEALDRTFCSLHAELHAESFSPEGRSGEGLWPVIVDDTTVLASPIILEDHPKIAPESPGDLFDGGEIDQLLVLNILAMTDEEKAEMRATDPRVREILERTESLTQEQLMALHGTLR